MKYTSALVLTLLTAATALGQDMPLSQILIEGEGWKPITHPEVIPPLVALTHRDDIVTRHGRYEIVKEGNSTVLKREGSNVPLLGVKGPSGITVWPDQGTLVIGDADSEYLWAFKIETDGKLTHGDRYYHLRMQARETKSGVTSLTVDTEGRLYACTPLGVQVFDPTGRLSGVIVTPTGTMLTDVGLSDGRLRVSCQTKDQMIRDYYRIVHAKGASPPSERRFGNPYNRPFFALTDETDKVTMYQRGLKFEVASDHEKAIADFTRAIALDPTLADAYNHRGSEHFKLGHIKESIADFDAYLKLKPDETPGHWKRGISYYYAGEYDKGKKQFEGYEKVDTNDVENAVWRYLCMARSVGVDKARAEILKIGNDRRIPMMKVYQLYSGKAKPEDVLADVKRGEPYEKELNSRLFYAHQYLGLYFEAQGDKQKALEHMEEAVKHKIGHYMWDVANVHVQLRKKK